ncbi:TIGR02206 family membrane protein, partial [Streptococcus suis]
MAMLFILWAKPGPLKRYFAYLGLFGSLAAFSHPVFDPFAFPHLTFFTFVSGHYAVTVNWMVYLLSALEGEM